MRVLTELYRNWRLARLRASLQDLDTPSRLKAVRALASWRDEASVPALFGALRSLKREGDSGLRLAVLEALRVIPHPTKRDAAIRLWMESLRPGGPPGIDGSELVALTGESARALFARYLSHDDPHLRRGAAWALAWSADASALPLLISCVGREKDADIRRQFAEAALHLGGTPSDPDTRVALDLGLGKIDGMAARFGRRCIGPLLAEAGDPSEPKKREKGRTAAIRELARTKDDRALAGLLDLLRSDAGEGLRGELTWAVTAIAGQAAAAPLAALLVGPTRNFWGTVVAELDKLDCIPIKSAIVAVMTAEPKGGSGLAMWCAGKLASIGEPEGVRYLTGLGRLTRAYQAEAVSELIALLDRGDSEGGGAPLGRPAEQAAIAAAMGSWLKSAERDYYGETKIKCAAKLAYLGNPQGVRYLREVEQSGSTRDTEHAIERLSFLLTHRPSAFTPDELRVVSMLARQVEYEQTESREELCPNWADPAAGPTRETVQYTTNYSAEPTGLARLRDQAKQELGTRTRTWS